MNNYIVYCIKRFLSILFYYYILYSLLYMYEYIKIRMYYLIILLIIIFSLV